MKLPPVNAHQNIKQLLQLTQQQAVLLDKKETVIQEQKIAIAESKALIHDKKNEITHLRAAYNLLLEQFNLAQKRRFTASSEKFEGRQGELFNEAESLMDEAPPAEDDTVTVSYTRKKGRKSLPKDLPRERIVHDIPESEKHCDCCGNEVTPMGEDIAEKLEFIPVQIKIIEHVRPKYTCRHCEKHNISVVIKQAPVPPSPIPKGFATPTLLAQIITSKFQYALPLYRQEQMYKQYGIDLSQRTMSDWMTKMATLTKPLYDLLHRILLQQQVIAADETVLKVINDTKFKSYMWVYCSGMDSVDLGPCDSTLKPIVLFNYQYGSRSGECAKGFLADFDGYLQVDGYKPYEYTKATLVGCWAHARRKFVDAKAIQPKGKTGKVDIALAYIQKLYAIEKQIKTAPCDVRYQIRQDKAKKITTEFKDWLDKSVMQISKHSVLGKALHYTLGQWPKLLRYLNDGLLNIDNNRAERAVKPFAVGRKNWLFNKTHSGAETSAVLYSLVETAKANGLIAFNYISYCLDKLSHKDCDLDSLLPWNVPL